MPIMSGCYIYWPNSSIREQTLTSHSTVIGPVADCYIQCKSHFGVNETHCYCLSNLEQGRLINKTCRVIAPANFRNDVVGTKTLESVFHVYQIAIYEIQNSAFDIADVSARGSFREEAPGVPGENPRITYFHSRGSHLGRNGKSKYLKVDWPTTDIRSVYRWSDDDRQLVDGLFDQRLFHLKKSTGIVIHMGAVRLVGCSTLLLFILYPQNHHTYTYNNHADTLDECLLNSTTYISTHPCDAIVDALYTAADHLVESGISPILEKHESALLMILGFAGFSIVLAIIHNSIRKYIYKDAHSLDTVFDAGGKVTLSLTAVTVTSQLLWPADFLQITTIMKYLNVHFYSPVGKVTVVIQKE
uniref:Uncharacterized protein n=1 Tax=Magallana gigas TaxID=29159 RepID=K1R174_MAGGI